VPFDEALSVGAPLGQTRFRWRCLMRDVTWRRRPQQVLTQFVVVFAVGSLMVGTNRARAQMKIPDEFKNLQILPKDIAKPRLVGIMKEFAGGLGVRCDHCHVERQTDQGGEFDFAADDKDEKKTARLMMKMVQDINEKWLSQLAPDHEHEEGEDEEHEGAEEHESGAKHEPSPGDEKGAAKPVAVPTHETGPKDDQAGQQNTASAEADPASGWLVRCVTCHHGLDHPRTIQRVVQSTIARHGVSAAIQKYRDLRKRYYGGFQYDFGEHPLDSVVQDLLKDGKTDDAMALLTLDAELNPESGMVSFLLGEAYLAQGDKAKAMNSYKKALELAPRLEPARQKLEALQKEAASGG
jgi:Tetratricopeptide repeat/Photosynthetic reaction centre cytochrome C subunit